MDGLASTAMNRSYGKRFDDTWGEQAMHCTDRHVYVDMCCTCSHVCHMSKMIQIRHVSDTLHRKLKVRATNAGMTLSDYLKDELERMAAQPTLAQIAARLRTLAPVDLDESPVETLSAARDQR